MPALAYIAFQGFVDERMERLISSLKRNDWKVEVFLIHPRTGWFAQTGGGKHYQIRQRLVTNPILNDLLVVPLFLFARFLIEFVKIRSQIRLIYVHNFPDSFALPLLLLAKIYRIPSAYEIRDPWKEFTYTETETSTRLRKRFKAYMQVLSIIEGISASLASGLVFVTTSLQESFIQRIRTKPACLVQNFSDYEYTDRVRVQGQLIRRNLGLEKNFVISYIGGGLQPYRGVDVLLESMKFVLNHNESIKLMIVGGHGQALASMRDRITELKIENGCILAGWVPRENLVNYYMASDAGVIPHRRTPATEITIPNKLFDYLVLGKPVIVTSLTELSRVITDGLNGLIVKPDSADELARGILRLASSPELMKQLSAGAVQLGEKCTFASVEPAFNAFISKLSEGSNSDVVADNAMELRIYRNTRDYVSYCREIGR